MNYRLSRDNEYTQVRRLWVQAFGDEEPWTSWYFSRHYKAAQTWVGEEDGRILAQAHLLPHRLMLRGGSRDVAYFVGVCVEEELRGTGIGRTLMATALAQLKKTGFGLSILQPRWPVFYKKMGWDYCYSRQSYSLPMSEVKLLLPDAPQALSWTPDDPEITKMAVLYDHFVQSRHGYALRDRETWEKLLADHCGDGGRVGILSCGGAPVGYAMYNNTHENVLRVREMIGHEAWMVDSAWKYLIEQTEMSSVDSLSWDDPSGDSASVLFAGSQSEPFLMGRVTDIFLALEAIEYPVDLSIEMNLTVTDSFFPCNQGSFLWRIRQGKGSLQRLSTSGDADFCLEIGTLSQLIFGEHSAGEILAAGTGNRYREKEQKVLEHIFPVCRNFISEYF